MHWVLGGYIWLYIHRPFEVWPSLGALQIERVYMLFALLYWVCYPGKTVVLNRLHAAFIAFALALVMCWLSSPYAAEGTKTVEDFFKVVVFYVLVVTTVRDEKTLRKLVLIYLAVVGLYMAHSLVEFVHGRHVYRMGIRRMVGVDSTYNDPNTFSATLLYSLPLTLPFWAERPRGWMKAALWGYLGLSVVCILLTGSRGALVGMGCLTALWLGSAKRRGKLVMLLVLAVPVGWSLLPEQLHNRFRTLVDSSAGPANAQQSAEGRTKGLLDGLRLWGRSPATGFGPNSFGKAAGHGFQAHSLYGQTLGEMGTLGLLTLAGMVACFALNAAEARRFGRDHPEEGVFLRNLSRAVSVAVVLLLVMGFGSHNLYRYTWLWFGAFQGIALYCLRERARVLALAGRGGHGEVPGWTGLPAGAGRPALAGGWDTDLRPV